MKTEKQNSQETASSTEWAYSTDGETYRMATSHEDAVACGNEGAEGAEYYVAPVVEVVVSTYFPGADDIIEMASERLHDEVWGDADTIAVSAEAKAELDAFIVAWATGIASPCFTIDHDRVETFTVDDGTGETP